MKIVIWYNYLTYLIKYCIHSYIINIFSCLLRLTLRRTFRYISSIMSVHQCIQPNSLLLYEKFWKNMRNFEKIIENININIKFSYIFLNKIKVRIYCGKKKYIKILIFFHTVYVIFYIYVEIILHIRNIIKFSL